MAKSQVLLSVALRDLNRVVHVVNLHAVIGDVPHATQTTSALEIAGHGGQSTGPDLDARTIRGVGHANVVDVNVLDVVDCAGVLAEGTDTNAVAAVADEVLDDDVCAVGLERDAIVAVVNVRVLNDNVVGAVGVPTNQISIAFSEISNVNLPVSVLGLVLAYTATSNVDVGENNLSGVGHEGVPLGAVSELQIFDARLVETNGTKENGADDVDVFGEEIVPNLAVAIESAASVNVDVFTAKLEEGRRVLEGVLEGVLLPVISVVGELKSTLDI
jgi:hypothetical protein